MLTTSEYVSEDARRAGEGLEGLFVRVVYFFILKKD
jgi:hypothetical protein